jgi:hypothetical protein
MVYFFSSFFILKNWLNVTQKKKSSKTSQIYIQKTKISQFLYQKKGEILPTKKNQ